MTDKVCDFVDNMFSSESTFISGFVDKGVVEEDIHSVIFIVFMIT